MKVRKSLSNKKNLCPFEKDGSTTLCKTSKKTGKMKECAKEAGDGSEEELAEEEKVILIHYEQRKVMLSQLHPIEVPDADPPSDLRQVHRRVKKKMKEVVSVFNFDLWRSRSSRQWPAASLSSSWTDMTTGL